MSSLCVTERTFRSGAEVYVALSRAVVAVDAGQPRQTRCSEMLHWDEFRSLNRVTDGAPAMMELFDPHNEEGSTGALNTVFEDGGSNYTVRSVAVVPTLSGSDRQTFCCEMHHWDYLVRQRQEQLAATGQPVPPSEPTMAQRFKPFAGVPLAFYDRTAREVTTANGRSVALLNPGDSPSQPFCTEMQHWDDYQQMQLGVAPAPTMRSLFGAGLLRV